MGQGQGRSDYFLEKKNCHLSSAFIFRPILNLYHTNVKYDNILGKLEFERSRAKVMVAFLFLETGKEMCP